MQKKYNKTFSKINMLKKKEQINLHCHNNLKANA